MFYKYSTLFPGDCSLTEGSFVVKLILSVIGISNVIAMCFLSLGICGLAPGYWRGFLFDIGTSSERLAIPGLCLIEVPDGNFIDQWADLSGSKLLPKYSSFGFARHETVIWSFSEDTSDKIISSFLCHSDISCRIFPLESTYELPHILTCLFCGAHLEFWRFCFFCQVYVKCQRRQQKVSLQRLETNLWEAVAYRI